MLVAPGHRPRATRSRDVKYMLLIYGSQDVQTATTVEVRDNGERVVTDGPFAETREILGGYYLLDVPDLDAALDWAARCPGAQHGSRIEVRPIMEFEQP